MKYLRLLLACLLLASAPASAALKSVLQVVAGTYTYLPTTNLAFVYSVRLAVSGYAGKAVLLRRASDNTTSDIGFVGNDLDVSTASTFCSGTRCYVKTWHDQSGNSVDVTQATNANQPGFIFAGDGTHAVVSCGGYYSGGPNEQFLQATSVQALTSDQTLGIVSSTWGSILGYALTDRNTSSPFTGWALGTGTVSGTNTSRATDYWSSTKAAQVNDTNSSTIFGTRPLRLSITRTSGTVQFYTNGVAGASSTGGGNSASTSNLTVCADATGVNPYNGALSEVYGYSSAQSGANLTAIDNSQSFYFTPQTMTSYAGTSAVSFSGNTTTGQQVSVGANKFQYDRGQAWTIFGAVNILGYPPGSAGAMIISSNVQTSTAFPGYEYWVDTSCLPHVRIISNITTPNYIGKFGSINVCDGKWHMLAASYDGSSTAAGVLIYEDGTLDPSMTVESDTLSATIVSGTQTLLVGNQTNHLDFWIRGSLDEYSLHNIARSGAYISAHSSPSSLPTIDANTVLMYHFDDDTGTSASDATGGGNAGTLSSSQQWFPN